MPEAETALLDVLADRGYAVEVLEGGISSVRVNGFAETRSVSMGRGGRLRQHGVGSQQKVTAFALRARERARLRETWAQVARFGLLAACLWSVQLASLFGIGLFVVANVFCDSGPWVKCFMRDCIFSKLE